MALAESLKIYHDTSCMLDMLYRQLEKFPRFYRYTIGERMVGLTIDILGQIIHANRQADKTEALTKLADMIFLLTTLFRSCVNNKAIPVKQYAPFAQLLVSLGKQATAWKNYSEGKAKKTGQNSPGQGLGK